MDKAGLDAEVLDSGCCGLAGNFGFEDGHYDISMACAERVLLPRLREAPEDAVVIADGFSCRTQIQQGGVAREGLHLAEVLAGALRQGDSPVVRPEQSWGDRPSTPSRPAMTASVGIAGLRAIAALIEGVRRWNRS
jgi:hypothetical protein